MDKSDERLKLEYLASEIERREQHEDKRQSTADSKLTSTLAVLPLIITLATTAFFQLLPIAAKLASFGKLLVTLFILPIAFFVIAVFIAIKGLDPISGTYSVVGLRTIRRDITQGSYDEMLRKYIHERGDAVRKDTAVNGRKFGLYRKAAWFTFWGIILAIFVLLAVLGAFLASPTSFSPTAQPTSTPTQPAAKPSASPKASVPPKQPTHVKHTP